VRHGPHGIDRGPLFAVGVDAITSGNRIWGKMKIDPSLESSHRILRPVNYGIDGVPGRGWGTSHGLDRTELAGNKLRGPTFVQPIENPPSRLRGRRRNIRAELSREPRAFDTVQFVTGAAAWCGHFTDARVDGDGCRPSSTGSSHDQGNGSSGHQILVFAARPSI
jgi:hypothetical protein